MSLDAWGKNVVDWLIDHARQLELRKGEVPEYARLRIERQEKTLFQQNAELSTLRRLIGKDKLELYHEAEDARRRLDEGRGLTVMQKNTEIARMRKLIGKSKMELADSVFALRQLILGPNFMGSYSSVERGEYYRIEIREEDYKAVRAGTLKCKQERRDKESTRRPRVGGIMRELAGYIVFLEGYWAPKMSAEVSRGRFLLSEEAIELLEA